MRVFSKIIIILFVALEEFISLENGTGWIIPFSNSAELKILIELKIKVMNSECHII